MQGLWGFLPSSHSVRPRVEKLQAECNHPTDWGLQWLPWWLALITLSPYCSLLKWRPRKLKRFAPGHMHVRTAEWAGIWTHIKPDSKVSTTSLNYMCHLYPWSLRLRSSLDRWETKAPSTWATDAHSSSTPTRLLTNPPTPPQWPAQGLLGVLCCCFHIWRTFGSYFFPGFFVSVAQKMEHMSPCLKILLRAGKEMRKDPS